jgi:hypothetical protein
MREIEFKEINQRCSYLTGLLRKKRHPLNVFKHSVKTLRVFLMTVDRHPSIPAYFAASLKAMDKINNNIHISIYNMHGNSMHAERLPATRRHSMDISNFPPGMYFLRVSDGNNAGTVRLIKR